MEDDAVGDAEVWAQEPEREHGVEQDQVDLVPGRGALTAATGRGGKEEGRARHPLDVDAPFGLRGVERAALASDDAVSTT